MRRATNLVTAAGSLSVFEPGDDLLECHLESLADFAEHYAVFPHDQCAVLEQNVDVILEILLGFDGIAFRPL